jgi:transketolase
MNLNLNEKFLSGKPDQEATRAGFGRGLVTAARKDKNVVALAADLTDSVGFGDFASEFPDRFVEVGIAEQNLVTVASGMAHVGCVPFAGSYAAFSPGRNWEQIRTTIALNNQPVKIVGSHAGLNVGPDGATHQMLEDIALMRVMPNMVVIAPGDACEAEKVAVAVAADPRPTYIRLARDKSPIFSAEDAPFEIGRAYVLRQGTNVVIFTTGTMTAQALLAAKQLEKQNISAEVVHVPTIKPLDADTILASAQKTNLVITVEEHQITGGFGSAIAELLLENLADFARAAPAIKFHRIGVNDEFGQSGTAEELLDFYGLTAQHIALTTKNFLNNIG